MKKLTLILMVVIACVACTKKQENQQTTQAEEMAVVEKTVAVEEPKEDATESVEDALPVAEQMPEYPGGMSELMNYLGENIKYPAKAKENNWEGNAICQFVVEKDGSIKEATILKSSGYQLLDAEALRVILSMPQWTAGMHKGDSVRVKFTLPISFKLK